MKKLTCIATAIAVLTGCASSPAHLSAVQQKSNQQKERIEQLLSASSSDSGPVAYSDRSWIPLRKVERTSRDSGKEQTDAVQIEINQQFANLNDVVGTISSLTGWPVILAEEVLNPASGAGGQAGSRPAGATAPTPSMFPAPVSAPPGSPGGSGPRPASAPPSGAITPASPYSVNYSGTLTGFINQVAAYYGVYWKVTPAGIRLYQLDSRTFRLAALPGDTRFSSNVSAGASTSGSSSGGSAGPSAPGSGGGSAQSGTSANSTGIAYNELSVWSSIETSIKQMLGANGKVVASPATGTITVTDTPPVLDRVAEFIEEQNKALNRQVTVNVRVLSVELNDGETYGIQWDAVFANLSASGVIGLKTAATGAQGVGNLILSAPPSSSSRWAGSSAIISALSTQGRVTELTAATVTTLNNQAVPVNIGRRVSYLASSSTTTTPDVGATTTLTPGTVNTGFSMTLVPHILDSKELLLQYSLDLSSLLQMKSISAAGTTIETPDISTSSFIQRVRLHSNETLVVAGFDQDNLSAVADGVGRPDNVLAGKRNGSSKRTMLVILIQPTMAK